MISFVRSACEAFVALARIAIAATVGTTSLSSSTCLPASSVPRKLNPVTFPPGRANVATKPTATGSEGTVIDEVSGFTPAVLLEPRRECVPE